MIIIILFFYIIYTKEELVNDVIVFEDRVFRNRTNLYYYIKEDRKCLNSSECQLDWCSSGSKCSNEGYCLSLMDYPCLHTTKCISQKRLCEKIQCFTKDECDDKIFCNGYEECDINKRICIGSKYPCTKGKICNEKNSSCSFIDKVSKWVDYSNNKKLMMKQKNIITIKENSYNIKTENNSALWDANSLGVQITFLVILIVMGILILGLCLLPICRPSKRTRYT